MPQFRCQPGFADTGFTNDQGQPGATILGRFPGPFEGVEFCRKMAAYAEYYDGAVLLIGLASLIIGSIIFVGAGHMQRLDSLGMARVAAILAIIPCTSPCCMCFGMPIGIWALVVLCDRNVAAEFNS